MDHQPTVSELRRCMKAAKDIRPLQALNNEFGMVAIKKPFTDDASDKDIIECLSKIDSSRAGFTSALTAALEDNVITQDEFRVISKFITAAMQSYLEAQENVGAYVVDNEASE